MINYARFYVIANTRQSTACNPASGAFPDRFWTTSRTRPASVSCTGMESRVAVLLAEGMTVREVAAATGRGESTIRSHVKHMFARHGLSRQAELVRLVLALALADAPESRR